MSGNNIKVVCRFRPQNKLEIKEGGQPIIDINEDGTNVALKGENPCNFSFDKIFGSNTRQQEVFDYSIKSIVDDVVAGYNGTVFAYGQTGSGKTFTMMGSDIDDTENKGIIPRIVEQIFESIMLSPDNIEFTVKVSYMEIYMEKVRDLLNPSCDNLPIHEDKVKGVYVKGVLEVYVSSTEEVYDVMRRGGSNRVVAYTNMNAESSRSHSMVMITITQKNVDTGAAKSGKLYLVDLAGSEKVGKTGASGQTLEEAKKINKSLTALGMVINALTDGKSNHIPYRDSKLTRILQESLGGNSRTTLIINCSPSSYNEFETISTLRFGVRAKTIKNKAKVNADLSPAQLKALLKKVKGEAVSYQNYITALEGEITIWRTGGTVPESQWVTLENVDSIKSSSPTAATTTTTALPSPTRATSPTTPVTNKSLLLDDTSRPSTPMALDTDERDRFIKNENELLEQISEKESELSQREKLMNHLQSELNQLKEQEKTLMSEHQKVISELGETKIQLEKVMYENKEGSITADGLKDMNQELLRELEQIKQQLATLQQEKQKLNNSFSSTLSSIDYINTTEMIHEKEKQIKDMIQQSMDRTTNVTPNERVALEQQLIDSKTFVDQYQTMIRNLANERTVLVNRQLELEAVYTTLLSEKSQSSVEEQNGEEKENDEDAKYKMELEQKRAIQLDTHKKELDQLKQQIQWKDEQEGKLAMAIAELKMSNEQLEEFLSSQPRQGVTTPPTVEKDVELMQKTMTKQLSDFDVMKRALMRDLQSRCERIVELEICLEETKEKYVNLLRATNNKAQQKKIVILERNLEQLTSVQKQMVEQNSHLKKEMVIADRKLMAKDERINNLEGLLNDAQEQSKTQSQRFENQIQTLKDKLHQALSNGQQKSSMAVNGFNRIVKPLRGGVAVQESEKREKRSSWIPFR
ncbi:kinesin heavy chain [Cunninghamella echinulata]|nr:kinesin heavy chain [Cunninghamella echinulata]